MQSPRRQKSTLHGKPESARYDLLSSTIARAILHKPHQTFRTFRRSDDPVCPICLDDWNANTSIIIITLCGHVVHRLCLVEWLSPGGQISPNTCPSCRAVCFPLTPEEETHNANNALNPQLGADSDYAANNLFDAIATHIEGIVYPLLELEEIYAQFGIDIECSNEPLRFIQAMNQVISAGVARIRIALRLHEGWMSMLVPHLNDWLTVKFLVASLFVKTQSALMKPSQWIDVLAARNRLGRAAFSSTDFGPSMVDAWLEYINDRYDAQYEVASGYFPSTALVRWRETNTAGRVVNKGSHNCTVSDSDSTTTYINVPGTDLSPGPALYLHDNSLWISERVIGNIVGFSIDEESRSVLVRSSADHTFKVEFLQQEL